jgi:hypothetical protein
MTTDLEFDVRRVLRTDYVRAEQNASGLAHPQITIPNALFQSGDTQTGAQTSDTQTSDTQASDAQTSGAESAENARVTQ